MRKIFFYPFIVHFDLQFADFAQNQIILGKVSDFKSGESFNRLTVTAGGTIALTDMNKIDPLKTFVKSIISMFVGFENAEINRNKHVKIDNKKQQFIINIL